MDMILDEYKTTLQVIEITKGYWDRTTGEYVEGAKTEVDFIGAVLPISQDDFRKNPDGGYTREDRKVYTNKDLTNGQVIVWNNFKWNAESDLDYSYIDPDFKRYFMRRVGKVSD
jgi:hypothetical protein